MRRPNWKPVVLVVCGLAAAVLASSAAAPAAPTAGPCLPPGTPIPPGVPKPPTCQKEGPASNLQVKVDGSITVALAYHSDYWGKCNAAHGGGSHTDSGTVLEFGTPTAAPARTAFRTDPKTKKKALTTIDAFPDIEATLSPRQDQRHEVPPGCGVLKDPTGCHEMKGRADAVVHLSDSVDKARVTVHPPALFPTQCNAPFVGNSGFDGLAFEHPLDDLDEAKMALAAGPTTKPHTETIALTLPEKPCGAYGIVKPVLIGGTLEKCTIKAEFRIVLTRLSQVRR